MSARTRLTMFTLLAVLSLGGCALFGKSEPLDVRYFSPEAVSTSEAPPSTPSDLSLRLGKVSAASHLDQRIVYRQKGHELGYYRDLRWTEAPEDYVRRGLDEMLFERLGVVQVVSGPGPTLAVELVAFEEVLEPRHVGRVVLSVSLVDERTERFRRTFVVEKPIDDDAPDAAVEALSRALYASLDRVAHETVEQLETGKRELAERRARKQALEASATDSASGGELGDENAP